MNNQGSPFPYPTVREKLAKRWQATEPHRKRARIWLRNWPYKRAAVVMLAVTAVMVFVIFRLPASVRLWSLLILVPLWLFLAFREWRRAFQGVLQNRPPHESLRHNLDIARMLEHSESDTILYREREEHPIVLLKRLLKPVVVLAIVLVLSTLIPEPTDKRTGVVLIVLILVGLAWMAKRMNAVARYGLQPLLIVFGGGLAALLVYAVIGMLLALKLIVIGLAVYWIVLREERWRGSYLVLEKSGIYTVGQFHWIFGRYPRNSLPANVLISTTYDEPGDILEELLGLDCGEITFETLVQKDDWLHGRKYTPRHRELSEIVRQMNETKG